MITKDEIEAKAEEFEIHAANVQRDYVFGWLLAGIYLSDSMRNNLVLKGGNCLRKAYFEHSRFSGDLDLSTEGAIVEETIGRQLNHVCDFVQEKTGVAFEKEKTRVDKKRGVERNKGIYEARIYFKDFYGNSEHITIKVRVDLTEFDKIFLPVQERNLIHPFSDRDSCSVSLRCVKLEELLACKLKCLLQRRHSADLYDFVYSILLNPSIELNRTEIVNTFLRMTIFGRSPGVVKGLLIDLPFQTIKGLWHKYIVFPKQGFIDYDEGVESFRNMIDSLFGGLPIGRGEHYFFPSNLRNPIMEAGRSMTMLEMIYDGEERLIEPYSLAYKRRRDGLAREYLYAYDTSGSSRSGPGLKSFVHPKIADVKNTDKKFEPRFEIELCKAGELLKNSYFARSPGRARGSSGIFRPTRRTVSRLSYSPYQYTIACPYCG